MVLTPEEAHEPGYVVVDTELGLVTAIGTSQPNGLPPTSPADEISARGIQLSPEGRSGSTTAFDVVDLGNRTIVPGFVDLHVHGGDGAQVNGDDGDEITASLERLARFHARHGTTSLLATTVSDSPDRLLTTMRAIAKLAAADLRARTNRAVRTAGTPSRPGRARIAGAHLEGPFISRARAGAQEPRWVRDPDVAELDRLVEVGAGALRLVTLAPELGGALCLIGRLVTSGTGVCVAVGHSDAEFETAVAAFEHGASHVTHLFNAMAPLHHRQPGIVGAALSRGDVTLELVADLEHVHPVVLEITARLARERIVAVSDATPGAGLPTRPGNNRQRLGTLDVTVSGRRVELARSPGTLGES
ncbi:MAG: N-acetylglucosamine-6-phosphate deacetylase [Acidimicrobiales bacterium]